MLHRLQIKNFVLIEESVLEFSPGFNVLTGETGAGKSIIMDAISLLLGARAQKSMIRKGFDRAEVEGIFTTGNATALSLLKEQDIDGSEGILIQKTIYQDRPSFAQINGKSVPNQFLQNLSTYLTDSAYQAQSQVLYDPKAQLALIDQFVGVEQKEDLQALSQMMEKIRKIDDFLEGERLNEEEKNREMDLLAFQIEEIDTLALEEGEDEEIEREFKRNENRKNLEETLAQMEQIAEAEEGLQDLMNRYISLLFQVKDWEERYRPLAERGDSLRYEWQDLLSEVNRLMGDREVDEERIYYVEERLNAINRAKRKYGQDYGAIYQYYEEITGRYHFLKDYEKKMAQAQGERTELLKEARTIALRLQERRGEGARLLESRMREEMAQLNFKDSTFSVIMEEKEIGPSGIDRVAFLAGTNRGEQEDYLHHIASGGEMSRILLAFKSIMAQMDATETLIFDEIDAGMSGRTAQIIAGKMSRLAEDFQLIVISHLPQVVAAAQEEFKIEKTGVGDRTVSTVRKLEWNERIRSLATMMSGEESEQARRTARQMMEENPSRKEDRR